MLRAVVVGAIAAGGLCHAVDNWPRVRSEECPGVRSEEWLSKNKEWPRVRSEEWLSKYRGEKKEWWLRGPLQAQAKALAQQQVAKRGEHGFEYSFLLN